MRLLCLMFLAGWLVGCQNLTNDDSDDTTTTDITTDISLVTDILSLDSFSGDTNSRDACSGRTFTICDINSQRIRYFSTSAGDTGSCTRGAFSIFGSSILTFTSGSCLYSSAGHAVTRTLSNHYSSYGGRKILAYTQAGTVGGKTISTSDLLDYGGTSRAGGATLTRGGGSVDSLSISGIHRRAVRANGNYGFWHTLYTSTALSVTRGSGTWEISSGDVIIAHNRAATTVTQTFSSVGFNATCCYPVSGSITTTPADATAAGFSAFTTTFSSTCGSVTLDGLSVTLPACGS